MYEVEMKFRVSDRAAIESRLRELGALPCGSVQQLDRYFAHPSRDFALTDEALRIRTVGPENRITFKGPRIGTVAKTRKEIEIRFADGDSVASQMHELLISLEFRPARQVQKCRASYQLEVRDQEFEIAIDEVDGLGCFVEIELLADAADVERAGQSVADLSRELGLSAPERRSYLEMLLANDAAP